MFWALRFCVQAPFSEGLEEFSGSGFFQVADWCAALAR